MQFGAYREWFESVGLIIEFDRWDKYTIFTEDGVYYDTNDWNYYEKSGFPTGASAINKCIKLFNYRKPARVQVLIEIGHPSHCICCKETKNLTFDHVIPTGKGGEDLNTNGQILCVDCNGLKGSKMINLDQLKKIKRESTRKIR